MFASAGARVGAVYLACRRGRWCRRPTRGCGRTRPHVLSCTFHACLYSLALCPFSLFGLGLLLLCSSKRLFFFFARARPLHHAQLRVKRHLSTLPAPTLSPIPRNRASCAVSRRGHLLAPSVQGGGLARRARGVRLGEGGGPCEVDQLPIHPSVGVGAPPTHRSRARASSSRRRGCGKAGLATVES